MDKAPDHIYLTTWEKTNCQLLRTMLQIVSWYLIRHRCHKLSGNSFRKQSKSVNKCIDPNLLFHEWRWLLFSEWKDTASTDGLPTVEKLMPSMYRQPDRTKSVSAIPARGIHGVWSDFCHRKARSRTNSSKDLYVSVPTRIVLSY